ncbi:MAG: glycosyltransferase family 2 protein [Desulfuromonadaceae bacterium]|nr:glycosyltransferase family 2 protein [Desulfuromonadaceae bacterium]MDD5106396.1 glycosyltransferase family 2 protein [Desulfuromonadaceae bacterium]
MTDQIYILLPVHNRKEVTRRFVASLQRQTYLNYTLVLVDDGSTDGTAEMVTKAIANCTVIKGEGDWWWGGALQQGYLWLKGADVASTSLVLFMNDDTEFADDFLERGASLCEDREKTLLLAQCYSKQSGRLIDAGVHVDWRRFTFAQAATPDEINCLSTRGLFLRAGDLMAIGGFHPFLLPHYGSDYEFTIRARRRGMNLMTHPSLSLVLDEETTGYPSFAASCRRESFHRLFSRRSVHNPLVWCSFVMLACPWPWKIVNLGRIARGFMQHVREIFRGNPTSIPDAR